MITVTQRIPTSSFAYIEYIEEYENIDAAIAEHKRVLKLYDTQKELSVNDWAKVRNKMLQTGECDPNLMEDMSAAQRWFINELKKGMRACSAPEPVLD